jgi:hypothetical protein
VRSVALVSDGPSAGTEVAPVAPRPIDWAAIAASLQSVWIGAFVVVNVLNAFVIASGDYDHEGYLWVLLDSESNPSTWFSSVVLLVAGGSALVCRLVDREAHERFWAIVGAVLVAMSFEEVAQVHELVSGNLSSGLEDASPLTAAWVLPALVGLVILVIVVRAAAPRAERQLMWGLAVGTVLFAIGAMGFEVLNSEDILFGDAARDERRVLVIATIEENLELIAGLVLARTVVKHLLRIGRPPNAAPAP